MTITSSCSSVHDHITHKHNWRTFISLKILTLGFRISQNTVFTAATFGTSRMSSVSCKYSKTPSATPLALAPHCPDTVKHSSNLPPRLSLSHASHRGKDEDLGSEIPYSIHVNVHEVDSTADALQLGPPAKPSVHSNIAARSKDALLRHQVTLNSVSASAHLHAAPFPSCPFLSYHLLFSLLSYPLLSITHTASALVFCFTLMRTTLCILTASIFWLCFPSMIASSPFSPLIVPCYIRVIPNFHYNFHQYLLISILTIIPITSLWLLAAHGQEEGRAISQTTGNHLKII